MLKVLKEFQNLPRFPDGRINYSLSSRAPAIICFVKYKDKILILKRSDKVNAYKGKWNSVGGYIDEDKPVKEKVLEELREELKIDKDLIREVREGKSYEVHDKSINKTWIIFPFLVELNKEPTITLDFEHTDFKWIKPDELSNYDVISGLDEVLRRGLSGNKV